MKAVRSPIAKFAVIGCGQVVQGHHLPAWQRVAGVKMVAVCDSSTKGLALMASKDSELRQYHTIDELLAEAPDLDFAVIATPGPSHVAIAKRLLQAGLHVLCEKPLTLELDDAQLLFDLADQRQLLLTPIHNCLFSDNSLAALSPAVRTRLGDIVSVNVRYRSGSLFDETPSWRHREGENHVLLFDFAYHFVDLALCFLGPLREIRFVDSEQHSLGLQYVTFGTLHENGARGLFELMVEASCRLTEIEIMGETAAIALQFFPEGFRRLPQRYNPVSGCAAEVGRLFKFSRRRLAQTIFGKLSPDTVGHLRLFEKFVAAIKGEGGDPVPREHVLRTISMLAEVERRAYARQLDPRSWCAIKTNID